MQEVLERGREKERRRRETERRVRDREEQDREKQERVRKAEQYKVREREEEQEMRQLLASVKQEMAKMNDAQKVQEKRKEKESEKEKEKERDSEKEREKEKEKEKEERGKESKREKKIGSDFSRVLNEVARNEEHREVDEGVRGETPSNHEEGKHDQSQIRQERTNDDERWEGLAQHIELLIRQEFDARENKKARRLKRKLREMKKKRRNLKAWKTQELQRRQAQISLLYLGILAGFGVGLVGGLVLKYLVVRQT